MSEAVAPDVHERIEVVAVGGFQRREVGGATGVRVGFENDAGKIEPAEQFAEKQADDTPVEITERVDGQKPAFGKSEEFKSEVGKSRSRLRPAGLQIEGIVAHSQRHFVRQRRMKIAYADFNGTPAPGPVGNEIGAYSGVQIEKERFIKQARGKDFAIELGLYNGNTIRKERR